MSEDVAPDYTSAGSDGELVAGENASYTDVGACLRAGRAAETGFGGGGGWIMATGGLGNCACCEASGRRLRHKEMPYLQHGSSWRHAACAARPEEAEGGGCAGGQLRHQGGDVDVVHKPE